MAPIPLIDLSKQYLSIKGEIDAAIAQIISKTAFIGGEALDKFEEDFARACGAHYGAGVSSGTNALHLALVALGVGPGDEVITVPNTFIATTEAITQAGAKIRFVDVNEQTYNIDVTKIEGAVTKKTKAIIPVHLYGQPCDIEAVCRIAKKHDLKVIQDAAQAHLAEFNGKPLGAFGDCACYSFYPGKNLGAYGDAGIVITNDKQLNEKILMLSNHGRLKSGKYEHKIEGYNCRMDNLQAAILNVKLKHLPQWTERRRAVAAKYTKLLASEQVQTPVEEQRAKHVFHLYVIRLNERNAIKEALARKNIFAGIHYPLCLHQQEAYQYLGYRKGDFPVSEKLADEILSLPIFPELADNDVQLVVTELVNALNPLSKKAAQNV